MKLKKKMKICLAVLAATVCCNVCAAHFNVTGQALKKDFLYMQETEKSFYKDRAYHVVFQAGYQNNRLMIASAETHEIYLTLQPYEDAAVAYGITELPVNDPQSGLFAVSATAGAHAKNMGYWLIGVHDGQWKIYVDYSKLQQNGFKPDEWNRLYGEYDEYNKCFAITNTTEYMPPWGQTSVDLINWPKAKWGCIWNAADDGFDLQRLETERLSFITNDYQAALYLEDYLKNSPQFKALLVGGHLTYSKHNPDGTDGLEVHEFKVIEDHPTRIITRAVFRINELGEILYYDVVKDGFERVS